jgi:hypothetical protein
LHAVGLVFEAMIRASGYLPQISVVVGFAAGGAAYGPALTDVVVMAPEGRVFVTGPDVVRSVTGEDVDMASLGGPDTHHRKSGVCHIVADDELAQQRGGFEQRQPHHARVAALYPLHEHCGEALYRVENALWEDSLVDVLVLSVVEFATMVVVTMVLTLV